MVGRKRKFNPNIPAHINQSKLPDGLYWDTSRRFWYTSNGKKRSPRLAGESATLSDLHKIVEHNNGSEINTFKWLSGKYKESKYFTKLKRKTQKDYERSEYLIISHKTKVNKPLGNVSLNHWKNSMIRILIDQIEQSNGPTATNHCLKYIRIVFRFGREYDLTTFTPEAKPVEERQMRRLPDLIMLKNLIQFAKERGHYGKDTCAPYLWAFMVITYQCRMRGVETAQLVDGNILDDGIYCRRTKGSRDNITLWNSELRQAVKCLQEYRDSIFRKKKIVRIGIDSLFVSQTGDPLKKSSIESAWKRLIALAIKEGVITESQRFGIHDLKRRGTTDTQGNRAEKQDAGGWKVESMVDIYDHSIAKVKPVS